MRTPNPGRFCFILGVSALAFGIAACSDDDSATGPITAARMYPDFTALADGKGGTQLRARVTIGGLLRTNTAFIDLNNAVNATVGTEQKPLPLLPDNKTGQFGADFAEPVGERNLSITHNVEAGAATLVSTATLPAPFTIELASTGVIPRDQPMEFTWSPADAEGRMDYTLSGTCIAQTNPPWWVRNIGSKGTFSIPKTRNTQMTAAIPTDDGKECQVTLTVNRVLYGTVDKNYKLGNFIATQSRVITFTSGAPVPAPAAP